MCEGLKPVNIHRDHEIEWIFNGGNKLPFLGEERYCQYELVLSPTEEYHTLCDVVGRGGLGNERTNVWRTSFLARLVYIENSHKWSDTMGIR